MRFGTARVVILSDGSFSHPVILATINSDQLRRPNTGAGQPGW